MQETRVDPWVGKILWSRNWQPTRVFSPREFHGQRSLAGHSPWGCKESDTTEQLAHIPSFYSVVSTLEYAVSEKYEGLTYTLVFKEIKMYV